MVPAGDKAKNPSLINHTTKRIHHRQHHNHHHHHHNCLEEVSTDSLNQNDQHQSSVDSINKANIGLKEIILIP